MTRSASLSMKAIYSILIVALIFILYSNRTDSGMPGNGVRLPIKAKSPRPKQDLEPDTLFADVGKAKYTVTTDGRISWAKNPVRFVRLNTEAWVGKVFLDTIDKKYLLVFYEEDFATDGAASVEKIDLETAKRAWQVHIPGFNLGQPYIKEEYAYINATGMIGKLNLRTGKYAYEFKDLYERPKSSFNNFDSISFRNNLTYFFSRNFKTKRVDTVIVDESSKKISIRN